MWVGLNVIRKSGRSGEGFSLREMLIISPIITWE
jgi:hypothetical protein